MPSYPQPALPRKAPARPPRALPLTRQALPLVALLVALTGCSSPLMSPQAPTLPAQAGQQALASASECCQTLADLPYRPLPANETLTLDFTPQTPAHGFTDGKSFFQAFSLPANAGPLTLDVTSPIRDGQVFAPTLLVLDAAFQPVRQVTSETLEVRRPTGFSGARLSGRFSVAPGPGASYLVIYSRDTDRQATTTYESEEKAYARVRGLAEPAVPDPVAAHTATGSLTLTVAPLTSGGLLSSPSPASASAIPPVAAPTSPPRQAPTGIASAAPATAEPAFDYRRMIEAALKAGDVELALELAERAERNGETGTRAWLAERLQTRTP
ncbi:MalM family protein [Salinicola avicenniae]|uniref:MalM family protein n=1 Tax=Salinicola avicenniae TaxID=2916836 RepID=UPI002072D0DD|nr:MULTISPECIES: MalM family protein [unclassified Salinicola]